MKPIFLPALAAFLAVSSTAASFTIDGAQYTVPDGFTVETIAGPPLVDRPICADFDEAGRLYIADSSGSNEKPDKQLESKPHRIVRLEDVDGDGKYDKSMVFADKMMFPEGCMWFQGSLYVGAPPSIWKLTDTDGDGVADRREEWFKGGTLTGCANDLHGPYAGPDGFIYWAKGAFAKQTHQVLGKEWSSSAAHLFRARPDGSDLEPVMTGGMDNPVEVAFSAAGERFFTTTFFQRPEAGRRDGLVHAIYGGVYGKPNDATDGHARTGELMPVMTHMGAAAPCGLMRYASPSFGTGFQGNLFACQFNMHKVSRHVLEADPANQATFRTEDSDFLTSDDPDFHPTDVIEDADGSLVVLDTGGWYKMCCPTSQLAKPDVLGIVLRIRKTGAPKVHDPRGTTINWAGQTPDVLVELLADARPVVQQRAIAALASKAGAAVPALAKTLAGSNKEARLNAVWTLTRVTGTAARNAVATAFDDSETDVRIAAAHGASIWRDAGALQGLGKLLAGGSSMEKRVAAEAIGRIGSASLVPSPPDLSTGSNPVGRTGSPSMVSSLLAAAGGEGIGRTLEHSIIFALIEIGNAELTKAGMVATNPQIRRAALIALDQMPGGHLPVEKVAPILGGKDGGLRETAEWIAARHPEWGGALAGYFGDRLRAAGLTDAERGALEPLLARFANAPEIQSLIASTAEGALESRLSALRIMGQSGLKALPDSWTKLLAAAVSQSDPAVSRQGVAAVRSLGLKEQPEGLTRALTALAAEAARPVELRIAALRAGPDAGQPLPPNLFQLLVGNLGASTPVEHRASAAAVLARAALTEDQVAALADLLREVGPLELARLFDIFEKRTDEALGLRLLKSLKDAKATGNLPPQFLSQKMVKYPPSIRTAVAELESASHANLAKQRAHLEDLLAALKGGDIRRGQAVFNSPKAACSSCHAIGYLGGRVGPDLTSIGQVRTERDLLESIVYPSASFVRSYEPVLVMTKDGEPHTGVLKGDSEAGILLVTGPNAEERIARADIREISAGALSIMPGGLDEQLSRQDLADLLAFLKATKWGAN